MKEVMLFGDLVMKLIVIDHFLNAMHAEIIKTNTFGEGSPLEIKKCVCAGNLDPVPISIF
jgi:hypothetical protein